MTRVALVTGAARGIGAATVRGLAAPVTSATRVIFPLAPRSAETTASLMPRASG